MEMKSLLGHVNSNKIQIKNNSLQKKYAAMLINIVDNKSIKLRPKSMFHHLQTQRFQTTLNIDTFQI